MSSLLLCCALLTGTLAADADSEDGVTVTITYPTEEHGEVALPGILDLAEAQRIALESNPSLMAADARVRQAIARIRQVRSEYFPQITGSTSASFTEISDQALRDQENAIRDGQIPRLPSIFLNQSTTPLDKGRQLFGIFRDVNQAQNAIDDTIENYQASISASWLLFDGLGREFRHAIAKYGRRESEAAYRESRRLLLNAVATAYHNVQLARENIAIAEADQEFQQRQLKEAQARRRVGTGSLSDVLNFQIRVKAAESDYLFFQRNYNVALIALMELLGVPESEIPEGLELAELREETPTEMQAPEAEEMVDYAYRNRPDLEGSILAEERSRKNIGLQRSQYWPSVNVFASRTASRGDSWSLDGDDFDSMVGVSVSMDLFTGLRRRNNVLEAKEQLREAEFLVRDAELFVAADVRQRLEDLRNAQEDLVVQRETTELVERNRELVEKEYRAGQGSLVRLNEAQRDLIAQQSQLALALVELRQSWHDLRTATGEILEPFGKMPGN